MDSLIKQIAIPFKIEDVYEGLAESIGILSTDGKYLNFEFQTKDSFIGLIKSQVKLVKLNITDIKTIRFKKGWFSSKIFLSTKSLLHTKDFPGGSREEFKFKIENKNNEDAMQFVSHINLIIAEFRLSTVENE